MRKLFILLLIGARTLVQSDAQPINIGGPVSISKAEYFFDHDPGVGKGTSISATTITGDSAKITSAISTSGLSVGFHVLYIRTQDNNGKWGLFNGRPFIISTPAPSIPTVADAEYFFDHDPGVGKGIAISGIATADSMHFSQAISASGLSNGFHVMYVRAKDVNG